MQSHLERILKQKRFKIIVKPNSSKNQIIKWDSDKRAFRVNIKARPESGKANLEIIKYFSKLLKKDIKIISGLTSKQKILKIS